MSLFCLEFPKNRHFLERNVDNKLHYELEKKKLLVMWMIDQYGAVYIIYLC